MKQLFLYLNSSKWFDQENNPVKLAELQIENCLEFCDPKDLVFVTNFPYSHRGVEAMVVSDDLFCTFAKHASKINVIVHLLEQGILDELTWCHDLDAYQLHPFKVELEKDIGLTSYEWKPEWNMGSFFFKSSALDFFKKVQERVYAIRKHEEAAILSMPEDEVAARIQKMNVTYNLGMRKLGYLIALAEKPCKVVHFPVWNKKVIEWYRPILTDRFLKLAYEKFDALH